MTPDFTADSRAGQHINYEVFWVGHSNPMDDEQGSPLADGWYAWACQPGCLPDGEPHGPYETSQEAEFAHLAPDSGMEQAP